METRAVVCQAVGTPLEVRQVELAPPGPGEVLIDVVATGVCASDLHVVDGDLLRPMPIVCGHEAAGDVLAVGGGVTTPAVGDRVVPTIIASCGACEACREGRPRACRVANRMTVGGTMMDGTTRLTSHGGPVHHFTGLSLWAERAVVPASACAVVGRDIPAATAALLGCAVATGVGAVRTVARPEPGDTVAVVGCGGVGLAAVQGARLAGVSRIVAVDVDAGRLGLATELGATDAVSAADRTVDEAVRSVLPRGADHVLECIGRPGTVAEAWRATRWGGQTTVVGLLPAGSTLHLDGFDLIGEKSLVGTYMGGLVPARDIPELARLVTSGDLQVASLVDEITLDDIPAAVDHLRRGSQRARQVAVVSRPASDVTA